MSKVGLDLAKTVNAPAAKIVVNNNGARFNKLFISHLLIKKFRLLH
jgi:hypothetical protein